MFKVSKKDDYYSEITVYGVKVSAGGYDMFLMYDETRPKGQEWHWDYATDYVPWEVMKSKRPNRRMM